MCHLHKFPSVFFLICCVVVHGLAYETSNNFQTRFLRSTETGCLLPSHPKNGKWTVINSSGIKWSPNMYLPSGRFIRLFCKDNYTLKENPYIMNCMNGIWNKKIGRCWKICPQFHSTPHLDIKCYAQDRREIKCSEATEGAEAEFRCKKFYKTRDDESDKIIHCSNNTWKGKIPECILDCGKNKFIDPTMVINGTDARKGAYPWQVALYDSKSKELFCGASLLAQRVVLTAAHCVSINNYNSKDALSVVVDNYYSQYNHSNDTSAQFASVEEIFLPERYQGRDQNYKNDIAIIVTKETFTLTENVQPICIDWNSEYLEEAINSQTNGYVAGWGYTQEDGNPASVLQELKVKPVDYISCFHHLPQGFKKFLTRDKLCSGHLNKSMAVCKGDSGGGLFFKHNNKFYVSAIVSVAPASSRALTDSCDSQQYSLYTNISYHRKFIAEKIAFAEQLDNNNTKSEKCLLPEHPQNGYWSVDGTIEYYEPLQGHSVKSGTRLIVRCYKQYLLNGSSYLTCKNGFWSPIMGKCLKTCLPIYNTKRMNVYCTFPDGSITENGCANATDGTLARFECAPFYEDFSLTRNPIRICVDGTWDQTLPECLAECGRLDEDIKKEKIFPWHVAIYTSTDKILVCSGSLINERVILTAAYCVINDAGKVINKNSLLVTVGGRYRFFDDFRDSDYIQISGISYIFKSSKKSNKGLHHHDFAIIVTTKTFKLTERVLPVCLSRLMITDDPLYSSYLYVSGWSYNTETNKHPDRLKTIQILKNSVRSCEHDTSCIFFSNENQICAAYMHNNSMICHGDSGASVVFQREDRYYLGGTVTFISNSHIVPGVCDRQKFGFYTNASSSLLTFILKKEAEFRPT